MFLGPETDNSETTELARGTESEKQSQLGRLAEFHARHVGSSVKALEAVQRAVLEDQNVFAELMHAARVCSLGQITDALFEVGGKYRRNM
jgi:methylmalonyl-CoA mutase